MEIKVQVENVQLADHIAYTRGDYNPVTDEEDPGETVQLGDLVVQEIARQFIADHGGKAAVRQAVDDKLSTMISEALAPMVAEAVAQPLQRTTRFGEPTGKPVTIRGLIVEAAEQALTQKVDREGKPGRDGYGNGNMTLRDWLVRDQVTRLVTAELQQVMKEEAERVKKAVRAQAAAHLAKTLEAAAS